MNNDKISNLNNFNSFVFLSTFARNLIEVFIPIILLKFGFSLQEILFFYILINFFALLLSTPLIKMANIISNRFVAILGVVSFLIVQLLLNQLNLSIAFLVVLAFFYSLYRVSYWISRRFYNLKVIQKEDIAKNVGLISIINQVAIIASCYIGSLFLDYLNLNILTALSIILFLISIIPLYKLKFEHEKNHNKLEIIKPLKKMPLSDIIAFGIFETQNVFKFLFPLYLFIFVKDNFQIVGWFSLVSNFACLIFVYVYSKMINKEKNYFRLSVILTVVIYLLKINIVNYWILIIAFLEGIFVKMYEISYSKDFYLLSKYYDYKSFNLIYELIINFVRTVTAVLIFAFASDLKTMLYISVIIISLNLFITFKMPKDEKYEME